MNRVGARPGDALRLAKDIAHRPELDLEAVFTHCAVADEPGNDFTEVQLDRFEAVVDELEAAGLRPRMLHAANSAATLDHPRARYDLVRAGIAVYGIAPAPALAARLDLRPALSLKAEVSMVKRVGAGEGVSYGLRHRFATDAVVATVPIGYADGVPRRLGLAGADVLIGGRRRPMVGVVTMDQLMVDCGDDDSVAVGDEVVLLGAQGGERIPAEEWAEHLGTIAYEVVCGIGPRVPRLYREAGDGTP
jgi:alanine racemase